MPRLLCLTGLVVSGLVFLLFLVDLGMSLGGMGALFHYDSLLLDIVFLISSSALGYLAWSTLRELK